MYHKVVLVLLILSNVLNIFLDREGSGGGRGLVQGVNVVAFGCVLFYLVKKRISAPPCFIYLKAFVIIFLLCTIKQLYFPNNYLVLGQYVRFALSIGMMFFFLNYKSGLFTDRLFQIYIVTFILQCSIKILNGNAFSVASDINKVVGGDTASMGLAMILPLNFLFFKGKMSFAIFICCCVFTLFSLRRTSIIAVLLVIPFYWPLIKMYMNKKVIALGLLTGTFVINRAWDVVGAKIVVRFMEGTGSSSGMQAYGSGRSEFWMYLLNDFESKGNFLLGNGFGSVYECFSKGWRMALVHAHSDFFEILYTYGVLGILIWVLFWKGVFVIGMKSFDKELKKMILGLVVLYVFIAFSSGCILRAEFFPIAIALPILIRMKTSRPL